MAAMAQWLLRALGVLLMLTALAVALSRAPDRPVETLVARWGAPPSQLVDLAGQLVHLRDEGPRADPEPLVLVHGTGASLHTWDGWAQALRGTRRVIRFDLPGFGLTGPAASGDYSGDAYARFTLALLDHLGVRRFAIGGNSLGGEVAWRTASLAPQRVARLVLVDASGYAFTPQELPLGFEVARLPGLRWVAEHLLPRAVVLASLRSVYGNPARVDAALVERYWELALREGNRRALGERLAAQARDMQAAAAAQARIKALATPTLVLWGGRDRLIPPEWGRRFVADLRHAELVLFDTLGHVPHEEDPARTVAPVKAFLEAPAMAAAS